MLSIPEIKKHAKNNLKGKWSTAIVVSLIYLAISFVISRFSSNIPFADIVLLVITIPLGYGLIYSFLKIYRNEEFSYGDFFTSSFNNFSRIWKVVGNLLLKLKVPIILLIVSIILMWSPILFNFLSYSLNNLALIFLLIGCVGSIVALILLYVKYLLYALSFYILTDNPDMSAKEIVEESQRIMNGQRGNYFVLLLSFIGWMFLAIFTFGIGMIFLQPYIQISIAIFYEDRIGKLKEADTQSTNV